MYDRGWHDFLANTLADDLPNSHNPSDHLSSHQGHHSRKYFSLHLSASLTPVSLLLLSLFNSDSPQAGTFLTCVTNYIVCDSSATPLGQERWNNGLAS